MPRPPKVHGKRIRDLAEVNTSDLNDNCIVEIETAEGYSFKARLIDLINGISIDQSNPRPNVVLEDNEDTGTKKLVSINAGPLGYIVATINSVPVTGFPYTGSSVGNINIVLQAGDYLVVYAYPDENSVSPENKSPSYTYTQQAPVINPEPDPFYPMYYGGISAANMSLILDGDNVIVSDLLTYGVSGDNTAKGNKTYTITTANSHQSFIYPASYGSLSSIQTVTLPFELVTLFPNTTFNSQLIDGTIVSYRIYYNATLTSDINEGFNLKF